MSGAVVGLVLGFEWELLCACRYRKIDSTLTGWKTKVEGSET